MVLIIAGQSMNSLCRYEIFIFFGDHFFGILDLVRISLGDQMLFLQVKIKIRRKSA